MIKKLQQNKKLLMYCSLCFLLLIFTLALSTRIRVNENKNYYTKNEVSLYLYTYHKLPQNFKTKEEIDQLYVGDTTQKVIDALSDNLNFGGDEFETEKQLGYSDWIGNYTTNLNQGAFECDIYTNRDELIKMGNRGVERLVYLGDYSEIFYTDNHYGQNESPGFRFISKWSINLFNNACWITLIILVISEGTIVAHIWIKKEGNKEYFLKNIKPMSKKVVIFILLMPFFLFVLVYKLLKLMLGNSNDKILH